MDVLGVMAWDWASVSPVLNSLVDFQVQVHPEQPRGGPPTLPKARTTTAGTASHPPRSMWDPARLAGQPDTRHAPTASQVHRCKASPARALPELAFSEQQGQGLPRMRCLPSCYPNDKKGSISLGKGVHAWRRCGASVRV